MSGTLSTVVVRALLDALEQAGADRAALLESAGLSAEVLADAEARVDAALAFRLMDRAPELTHNELFCLEAAAAIPLGALEVLDFTIRSSATLREAIERTIRYYPLVDDRTSLMLERHAEAAVLIGKNCSLPAAPRPATELLFGLVLARGKQLTGVSCPLRHVRFLQGPPLDVSGHERFFGVEVSFSQARDELEFDAAWLDAACLAADPALSRFFERYASDFLERLRGPATFVDEVRGTIARELSGMEPTLDSTAASLGMSDRTLQRRLSEASTSYKELLDDVRRSAALSLLKNPGVSIGEVGYLLGFADTSTFYRAFKRWTGGTPAEHRRSN